MTTFEFNGDKYKKASKHQKKWGNEIIAELDLRGDEHILDLGCGDGVLTEQLAQRTPRGHVTGIDASTGMIQTAQKIKRDNLNFIVMNINAMRFNQTFDIIYSNATLHWIIDHASMLRAVYRYLNDDGFIRFNFAADGNCAAFISVLNEVMNNTQYIEHFRNFNWPWYMPKIDDYAQLVRSAGFTDVNVWPEHIDQRFHTPDDMIRWLDQPCLVPFLPALPKTLQAPFRDTIVEMMLEKTRQPDDSQLETFERINAFAHK